MWCPEGYVTLNEILAQFAWDCDLVPTGQGRPGDYEMDGETLPAFLNGIEHIAYRNWLFAVFLKNFERHIRVCLTSGSLVRLAPRAFWFLSPTDLSDLHFLDGFPEDYQKRQKLSQWIYFHVDLESGTIKDKKGGSLHQLSGLPLCVPDNALPVPLDGLTEWLLEEGRRKAITHKSRKPPSWSSAETAQLIVEAFRKRRFTNRAEAKHLFAKDMPIVAWKALWKEAAAIEPSLSRPGPK